LADQLTAHVVVTGPPESAFGAEASGPFIGPEPLLPDEDVLPLEPPLLLVVPLEPEPELPAIPDVPPPDDEVDMLAGSGGVMCERPFGGP
jgi:hypothetical protein